jgi:capsid portal protein
MDKVGMGFRLPRLLRGDIRDFNRASAEAALDFAEAQVFAPERNDFDFAMNRHILPALGIRYWHSKSNGPRLSDSQSWGEMIAKLTLAGVLTPEDARALAGTKVLSQELHPGRCQPSLIRLRRQTPS